MPTLTLPPEVAAVLREFRVCEFTTFAKDGTPTTWPTSARYEPEAMRFLITTSIGLPQKAFNIRRNPCVALLFSDTTGSGLTSPPAVLVQGEAIVPDKVVSSPKGLEDYWRDTIFRRQPATEALSRNPVMRRLMDWYYMRLLIWVTPRRILWWPERDFTRPAQEVEVPNVG
jgi:general stress protein 26